MRSNKKEDLDNLALYAFIVKRRVVSTPESSTKRPTTRLQAKMAYVSALQKSRKDRKKQRRKLVKYGVPVSDKVILVVEVEEETPDEPGSLVRRSQKKKQPTSVEKVSTSGSKLKDVVSEFSISDEDMLVKTKGNEKSSGGESNKWKFEIVQEPGYVKRMRSEVSLGSEHVRHQNILLGRTFDPSISEMAGMHQILEMIEFQ